MIAGKLRIIGQISVVEEDQPTGQCDYGRAMLIEFDSDEAIRQAINEERCSFSFGEPDTAPQPMSFHVQELRPEVLAFALLMEQRLREKDAEWGGNSWKDADIGNLQVCATAKIFSIETAILKGPEKDAIKHSVDLANYAMMIADVAGALDEAVEIINGEPQH